MSGGGAGGAGGAGGGACTAIAETSVTGGGGAGGGGVGATISRKAKACSPMATASAQVRFQLNRPVSSLLEAICHYLEADQSEDHVAAGSCPEPSFASGRDPKQGCCRDTQ